MDASTTYPSAFVEEPGVIIASVTYYYLNLGLRVIVNPVLAVLALCAAIINVVTFARIGLNKGINQSLFVLSLSDFVLAALLLVGNLCYILLWFRIQSMGLLSTLKIVLWLVNYPNTSSIVVTTVIAVVRCLCVVMPLSFRSVVTDCRQLVIIAFCSCIGFSVILYCQFIMSILQTSITVRKNANVLFNIFRNTFFYILLLIIIVSMVFLTLALKKSAKFQIKSAANSSIKREAQVIKTMILILVIFVTCNIPLILLSVLRLVLPTFGSTGQYRNVEEVVDMLIALSLPLNIGLNTFVYLAYNSRFRNTFLSWNSK
ncbi:hypothetical protein RRG08_021686 [Elysia crispata]|uniref:G-protein coupled receptors family 1 profile domain-containing protein n=1 Tax=Elysia crispata TaxID=231223 RepID=A0AAE0ZZM6_9GAST|nr:hypothetical protein RRG08_021686 [Elysia crispata]